ncbi:dTDP-4-dehydrorhamnose 3,5-epimerase [Desulfovibrionales bacterium]
MLPVYFFVNNMSSSLGFVVVFLKEIFVRVITTELPGVYLIEPTVFNDVRGFFIESYNSAALAEQGIHYKFIQDNHAKSDPVGVLRGLHFQLPPKAQAKLVRVTAGAVYDVIVDLRVGSPTFRRWSSFKLTSDNFRQLLIPKGFAHGYMTLAEHTEFLYKVDEYYDPKNDAGIIWNDFDLNIDWPITKPVLSIKDQALPHLRNFQSPFVFKG